MSLRSYKKLPSEIPPLETIRDRVVADYKFDQARFLATKAAQEFYGKLTNGLAQGKSFAALAADAKVKLTELPPFSPSTRELPELEDRINLDGRGGLKQIVFTTPVGKISTVHETGEGAIIVHVKSRLPLDEAKMKTDLPAFIAAVRQSRENEAFNKWFTTERDRGLRDTPVLRQQPPAQGAPGPGGAKS